MAMSIDNPTGRNDTNQQPNSHQNRISANPRDVGDHVTVFLSNLNLNPSIVLNAIQIWLEERQLSARLAHGYTEVVDFRVDLLPPGRHLALDNNAKRTSWPFWFSWLLRNQIVSRNVRLFWEERAFQNLFVALRRRLNTRLYYLDPNTARCDCFPEVVGQFNYFGWLAHTLLFNETEWRC